MNEVQVFKFESNEIRSLMINGEPWFVGKDVAEVLGYKLPRKAILDHVDEDDKGVTKWNTLGGTQEMTIINESGLYSLILSSKLPRAKKFKRWVTSEVLPAIRKTGSYGDDKELSYEKKIKIAELITQCKNVKSVEALMTLFEIKVPVITKEIKGSSSKGVRAYIADVESWELTEVPTKSVHSDYESFCKDNNFVVLSLNEFSKEIKRQTGMIVKRHRVNGKLTGFYEFN